MINVRNKLKKKDKTVTERGCAAHFIYNIQQRLDIYVKSKLGDIYQLIQLLINKLSTSRFYELLHCSLKLSHHNHIYIPTNNYRIQWLRTYKQLTFCKKYQRDTLFY